MEHHVQVTRTDHADASVPPALHATCACGWAAESHDEEVLRALVREHEQGDHGIPVPASPTPEETT